METITSSSVSVPCRQNHETEILFPTIIDDFLTKYSIYLYNVFIY